MTTKILYLPSLQVSFLFLVLSLSGCLVDEMGPCDGMRIPQARGGDVYTYIGTGMLTFALDEQVVGSWPSDDKSRDETRKIDGGVLSVTISRETTATLNMAGAAVPAFHVNFQAEFPDRHPQPFVFSTQMVDPTDSSVVSGSSRPLMGENYQPVGEEFYSLINRPPLMLAPLFWDRSFSAGDAASVVYPVPFYAAHIPLPEPIPQQTLRYEVLETESVDGVCQALIHIDLGHPRSEGVFLRMAGTHPLPVFYEEQHPKDWDKQSLEIELNSYVRGEGDLLAPFSSKDSYPESRLVMKPRVDGFLADAKTVFPTGYTEAYRAALEKEFVAEWLDRYPNAEPMGVVHRMGTSFENVEDYSALVSAWKPGYRIVDEWQITWVEPQAGNNLTASVGKYALLSEPNHTEIDVNEVQFEWKGGWSGHQGDWVTLEEFARVHDIREGEPLEYIYCQFDDRLMCKGGTHENTNTRRAGEVGGGAVAQGLTIYAQGKGWVLTYNAWNPVA